MSFPERLQALQKERKVTKKNVFQSIGMSKAGYYLYEQGEREPTLSKLVALSNFFNVSIDYLVGRTNNPQIAK